MLEGYGAGDVEAGDVVAGIIIVIGVIVVYCVEIEEDDDVLLGELLREEMVVIVVAIVAVTVARALENEDVPELEEVVEEDTADAVPDTSVLTIVLVVVI